MRVSAGGGSASALTTLDPSRKELRHAFPSFPDGRRFIYLRSGTAESSGIYVASLDGGRQEQNLKLLVATKFGAAYVPSGDPDLGQLLYVRDGALMAQSFDARRMKLAEDAVTLAEWIGTYLSFGFFSASTSGALVHRTTGGNAQQQLTWYDGQGKALRSAAAPGDLVRNLNLSPDGVHAAVSFSEIGGQSVVWLLDFSRGTSTRFTFGSSAATAAVCLPRGAASFLPLAASATSICINHLPPATEAVPPESGENDRT